LSSTDIIPLFIYQLKKEVIMPISHFEVLSASHETVSGTSKATGKPFSFNKQVIYAHQAGNPYPDKTEIILQDDQAAYPVGTYTISNNSIYVDRNNRLALSPMLIPTKKAA
jgi:hypothetical protein